MSGQSPWRWWWWWCHQIRQLSQGWLSQTCRYSRSCITEWFIPWAYFNLSWNMDEKYFSTSAAAGSLASGEFVKSRGGSEVELLIRRQRGVEWIVESRAAGWGPPIRELRYAEKRRWPFLLFAELKSRVCRLWVTFKLRALLCSSFFIAFFAFAEVGSVGASRPGHLLCLAGIRWINTCAGETFPLRTLEGLAEARPQGQGAIFTLTYQHLPEQRSTAHSTFSQNFHINECW